MKLARQGRLGQAETLAGWRQAWRQSRSLRWGLSLLALVLSFCLAAVLLTPYAPDQLLPGSRLLPPSGEHPFGTDALGRDLLSRVAFGGGLALQMAALSIGLSLAAGLALGSLAGYYGGWVDQLLSRLMDGWLALPAALVAVVIVARLGASLDHLILALGLMGVPTFYRMVRSNTLSVRCSAYVEAAITLGARDSRVMWRHVFPNILSPLVVLATTHAGIALLTGSSLSFIGLGAQPPLPEWGSLMAAGRNYLDTGWWLSFFPGLAVTLTVIGLNLLGDGLRDALDPGLCREEALPQGACSEPQAGDWRASTRTEAERSLPLVRGEGTG